MVLLEQHRDSLSAEFKSSLGTMDSKLDQMRLMVEDHGWRISTLETFSDDIGQHFQELESLCSSLQEDNAKLAAKVNLEGRSRQQNICILALPENTENRCPTQFLPDLLREVFGNNVLPPPEKSSAPWPGGKTQA